MRPVMRPTTRPTTRRTMRLTVPMRVLPALLLAAVLAPASRAAAGGGHDPEAVVAHIFDAADTDRSGTLTATEYEDAGLARFGVPFEQSDANRDGETSLEEYLDLYRRHHPPADQSEV